MIALSLLALFVFVFFLCVVRFKIWQALYGGALISVTTFFGVVSSVGFFVLLLSFVFTLIANHSKKIRQADFLSLLVFSSIAWPVIMLSLSSGADFIKNSLKFFQTVVVFSSLLLVSSWATLSDRKVYLFSLSLFFLSIIFGAIGHVFFQAYDLGIIRFSGIIFDANFFALMCLVVFCALDYRCIGFVLRFLLALMILGSLSASGILLLFLYLVLSRFALFFLLSSASFALIAFLSMFIYLLFMDLLSSFEASGTEGFLQYKLMSLSHRLEAQFLALDVLKEKNAFWVGVGSGRNVELTGIALHNGLFQLIFSHGLVFYALVIAMLSVVIHRFDSNRGLHSRRKYYATMYILLVACFSIDPIYTLYFHMYLMMINIVKVEDVEVFSSCRHIRPV